MAFGSLTVGRSCLGRWKRKPLASADLYTNGDNHCIRFFVCVWGMNPGHHTYEMTPLALLLHFKLRTVIFFFKTKFSVYHFAGMCVCTSCVPGVLSTQKRMLILWNWSYRWLWFTMGLRIKAGSYEEQPEVQSCLSSPDTNFLLTYLVYNLKLEQKTQCSSGIWATEKEKWKIQGWSWTFA